LDNQKLHNLRCEPLYLRQKAEKLYCCPDLEEEKWGLPLSELPQYFLLQLPELLALFQYLWFRMRKIIAEKQKENK